MSRWINEGRKEGWKEGRKGGLINFNA